MIDTIFYYMEFAQGLTWTCCFTNFILVVNMNTKESGVGGGQKLYTQVILVLYHLSAPLIGPVGKTSQIVTLFPSLIRMGEHATLL